MGIGLLVGLEREWAQKDLGVRTFAIVALLGTTSMLISVPFAMISMIGVFLLIISVNLRTLLTQRALEITTSAALLVTFLLGVLVGAGHLFTPVASALLMTMLLAWKAELRRFAGGLQLSEIRGAVLLGLLGFVVYPVLPNEFIDPWHLINPRQLWITIIIVAGISFANYTLLRVFSTRGLYYTAVLGGLVNSTATVAEISSWISGSMSNLGPLVTALVLLTVVAMFLRNLMILAIFAPAAVPWAIWPLLCMAVVAGAFAWFRRGRETVNLELQLSSPVSLRHVFTFGAFFVLIEVLGTVAERYAGKYGFLVISALGGFVSSASSTAAGALMAANGKLSPEIAGAGAVLASISSALVNLPLVYRRTHQREVVRTLTGVSLSLVVIGLLVLWMKGRL
jgi:uncharacterized membrane protein (DUF4010 family)